MKCLPRIGGICFAESPSQHPGASVLPSRRIASLPQISAAMAQIPYLTSTWLLDVLPGHQSLRARGLRSPHGASMYYFSGPLCF